MKKKQLDINFIGTLSSCLEQYVKGKIQSSEILRLVEKSLPEADKKNWNPKESFEGFELIETFLEVKGMTQTDLAKSTGLTPAKINDLIKGRRKITPKTATKLAEAFEVEHTVFL